MNIEARQELMEVLMQISKLTPYVRLGQLLGNLIGNVDHPYGPCAVYEIEDEELLPSAIEHLEMLRRIPAEEFHERIENYLNCDNRVAATA